MSISKWVLIASCYAAVGVGSLPLADLAFRSLGDRPSQDLSGLFTGWSDGTYRLARGVRTSADFYSGHMDVFTDSLGMRVGSAPSRWHRQGDTTDILLLGDSQTFGNQLNWEQTIGGQLDSLAATVGWRVANAGTGAHSLQNQIDVARSLLQDNSLVPRRIVVLLTPLMINSPGHRNRAQVGADGRLYEGESTRIRRFSMWLKLTTTVYSRARGAFRYVRESIATLLPLDSARDPGVVGLYDVRNRTATKWDSLATQLSELKQLGADVGAQTVVAYLPLAIEGTFDVVANLAIAKAVSVEVTVPQSILATSASLAGVAMINLRPALDTAVTRNQPLAVISDPHYSAPLSALISHELWLGLRSHSTENIDVRQP